MHAELPLGRGDVDLENELPVSAAHFKKVRFFPMYGVQGVRPFPPNVVMERLIIQPGAPAKPAQLLRHAGAVRRLLRSLLHDLGLKMFSNRWLGR